MKTKKENKKELTAKILDKIQEAFSGVNDKAVKKIKRSAEGTAKKLAKKITASLDKIAKKEKALTNKAKKKSAKKEKKVKSPLTVQAEKVDKKKLDKPVVPAPVKTNVVKPKVSATTQAVKAAPKKNEAAPVPVAPSSSNGLHDNENKEA